MTEMTTLCYIEYDGCYLMLRRDRKEQDINAGKWIGVGGHFLPGETPEECLVREVREETGLSLSRIRFRGIVTFRYGDVTEYMHLFTASPVLPEKSAFSGPPADARDAGIFTAASSMPPVPECDEGTLAWILKEDVPSLPVWEGDRIFLRLLTEDRPCFLLTLTYDKDGTLTHAVLDGETL